MGRSYYATHLTRVAANTPERFRAVAWLHDVLEDTEWTVDQLRGEGVAFWIVSALVILDRSRFRGPHGYRDYIRAVASAEGWAGTAARVVKFWDLTDNLGGIPAGERASLRKRYTKSLAVIAASVDIRGEVL